MTTIRRPALTIAAHDTTERGPGVLTVDGSVFYPESPEGGNFSMEVTAHALSMICIEGGHIRQWWSYARRGLQIARVLELRGEAPLCVLEGLLSVAPWAYTPREELHPRILARVRDAVLLEPAFDTHVRAVAEAARLVHDWERKTFFREEYRTLPAKIEGELAVTPPVDSPRSAAGLYWEMYHRLWQAARE